MKLYYLHTGEGALRVLVLKGTGERIELYIKSVDEEAWALVGLGGQPDQQPWRHKCQGPYDSAAHAEGAVRGIAAQLLERGYHVVAGEHPVWAVQAQRFARNIRRSGEDSSGVYAEGPEANEPLW